jgi:hypothetical protein
VKNNFKKIKKYYFNLFTNKKHFKNNIYLFFSQTDAKPHNAVARACLEV